MPPILIPLVIALVLALAAFTFVTANTYRRLPPERALVITRGSEKRVSRGGTLVLPVIMHAEEIDLTTATIAVSLRGRDAPHAHDNLRVELELAFYLRIEPTTEDILRVATSVGCARAMRPDTLRDLFYAKFVEAVRTVVGAYDFGQLHDDTDRLRDQIVDRVGRDLTGYSLVDVAIVSLGMLPISAMNPDDILDALGIKKATEVTQRARLEALDLDMRARRRIAELETEAAEALAHHERTRDEAVARQRANTAAVQIRQATETLALLLDSLGQLSSGRPGANAAQAHDKAAAEALSEISRVQREALAELEQLRKRTLDDVQRLQAQSGASRAQK